MDTQMQTRLDRLNSQQREAVLYFDSPLVVFAGAGSGKTRVITTKLCYAIKELGIPSWKILAVTFTNKACKEMQERVVKMLPDTEPQDLCIKTFHSFGAMVLRRFAGQAGLSPNFKIYDDEDSAALLAQACPGEKRADLTPVAKRISLCKDRMQSPEDVLAEGDKEFYNYYIKYEETLRATGNVDFADLIGRTTQLIEDCAEVRDWCHGRFKIILVDEYQDSNAAQCRLLTRIAGPDTFVCVVGDDDQSIYRFRGAEMRNILNFNAYFPGCRIIKLEQNYRSTKSIVALASSVISKNLSRQKKEIFTDREQGKRPLLCYVDSDYAEAYAVASVLQKDCNFDNSAVLYRTNAQSAVFESTFNRLGIPYKLVGALRFYEREEVKDTMAYLSVLLNPKDRVSFTRIINKPPRGIGPGSLNNIVEGSVNYGGDLIETLKAVVAGTSGIKVSSSAGIAAFLKAFEKTNAMMGNSENSELFSSIIAEFGIREFYIGRDRKEQSVENRREKNLEQIINIVAEREDFNEGMEGLYAFIEEAALDPTMMADDTNTEKPGVTLITMHNTKGLEFDRVFITGLEDGLFPSGRSETLEDMEEERRIFYVAITRARNELYMYSCKQRRMWGQTKNQIPSQFISDLPKEMIDTKGSPLSTMLNSYAAHAQAGSFNQTRTIYKSPSSYDNRPKQDYYKETYFKPKAASTEVIKTVAPAPKKVETPKVYTDTFSKGDRLYNDAYGNGTVAEVKEFAGRKVLVIEFDDKRRASFVEGKANLKKI